MKTITRNRRRVHNPRLVELLEPRTLLSATISSYSVTDLSSVAGAYDSDGNLWVINASFASGHQTIDEIINGAVAHSIIIDDVQPNAIAAGANGHLWVADAAGGLDDINTLTDAVTPHLFVTNLGTDFAKVPLKLSVSSSGNVWFIGAGDPQASGTTNVVGRYNPGSDTVSYLTLNSATNDSTAFYISANGADGAWVGMPGLDHTTSVGANHIVNLSYSGSIGATYYAVHTLNAVADAGVADAGNPISGIASDGTGGVWFSLANSTSTAAPHGADRVVHGVVNGSNLDQTAYVLTGATPANPLTIISLGLDSNGFLWFSERSGPAAGYFDTGSHAFSFLNYPANSPDVGDVMVSPTGDQVSMLSFDDSSVVVQIDVTATVTFSGSPNNIAGQEHQTFNSYLLATFVAPPPGTGSYSAAITWGDSTTSTVSTTYLGSNTYAVVVSGKSFNSQGTYNGTITIKDSANVVAGTMNFQSVITDTPLIVTSFAATPLILRIATATATFTDDVGRAASTFTATINWGDNTSSTGLIVADPTQAGRFIVIAIHQYRRRGTYTAHLTINTTEAAALIVSNSANATVTV